jgi:hypothetical protein
MFPRKAGACRGSSSWRGSRVPIRVAARGRGTLRGTKSLGPSGQPLGKGVRELYHFGWRLDDTNPREGEFVSKETSAPSGSLTLCRAGMAKGGQPSGVMSKPMRGGSAFARGAEARGVNTSQGKRQERIGLRITG